MVEEYQQKNCVPPFRLFVLGDSISEGYGPSLETFGRGFFTYARKTGAEPGLPEAGLPGVGGGGDSAAVLAYLRFRAETGGIPADLLLLNCGLHDLRTDPATGAHQIPLDQYGANLREILGVVKSMGLQPVWVTITPVLESVHNGPDRPFHRFNRDLDAYNATAREIMLAGGALVLDLHAFTANLGPEVFTDGVHFVPEASAFQAAFLVGSLVSGSSD
jgi:lysophospholipase L1-like esterase